MYVLVTNHNGQVRVKGLRQALEHCDRVVLNKDANQVLNQLRCDTHSERIRGLHVICNDGKVDVEVDTCCDVLKFATRNVIKDIMLIDRQG